MLFSHVAQADFPLVCNVNALAYVTAFQTRQSTWDYSVLTEVSQVRFRKAWCITSKMTWLNPCPCNTNIRKDQCKEKGV